MLLTFSRRAAAEMTRRVERITAHALRGKAGLTHALTWSGTFHAIGARLLREYAPQIGLDRAFTIHDREDSADLLNLIRHDLGLSKMEKRFPTKGTCLAIYSRAVNAETPLERGARRRLPLVRDVGSAVAAVVRSLCRSQATPECARLRRSAALLGADDGGAVHRRGCRGSLRSCAGGRISGHQPAAGVDPPGAEARMARGSLSWATMPNRSTRSARRRCATSSIFPAISPRAPQSSRWSATIARHSRSLRPRML